MFVIFRPDSFLPEVVAQSSSPSLMESSRIRNEEGNDIPRTGPLPITEKAT